MAQRRYDDDGGVGRYPTDERQRLPTVHARHEDVEQDGLGLQALGEPHRLLAVTRFAHHLEPAVVLEEGASQEDDVGLVVDEHHPSLLVHVPFGPHPGKTLRVHA